MMIRLSLQWVGGALLLGFLSWLLAHPGSLLVPSTHAPAVAVPPATLAVSDPPAASPSPSVQAEILARVARICHPEVHTCSRPLEWEEIAAVLAADQLQLMARLPDNQRRYTQARAAMMEQYRSVSDHVREHKFGATCISNAEGKKECVLRPEEQDAVHGDAEVDSLITPLPPSILVPNDFPYALAAPIQHDLIWLRGALTGGAPLVARLVEQHRPAALFDTLWMVNPPHLQTITDIAHIHVFYRPRAAGEKAVEGQTEAEAEPRLPVSV